MGDLIVVPIERWLMKVKTSKGIEEANVLINKIQLLYDAGKITAREAERQFNEVCKKFSLKVRD